MQIIGGEVPLEKSNVMGNWTGLLINPQGIRSIFPITDGLLDSVELHDIKLDRSGPTIVLRFNLEAYPENPPKKWEMQGFNCVQLELRLIDVTAVSINGWSNVSNIRLEMESMNGEINVRGANEFFKFEICAKFANIGKIWAYEQRFFE